MKLFKQIILSIIIIISGFSLCGCDFKMFSEVGDLKDVVLGAMNRAMESFSVNLLTRKYRLTGTKTGGKSPYTGSYEAEYKDFNGKEVLFGSTSLNLDGDIELRVEYEIDTRSGECCLFRVTPGGVSVIASGESGSVKFEAEPGDNYIIFQGDHFTGELKLISEPVN